jgi:hypothetical protein
VTIRCGTAVGARYGTAVSTRYGTAVSRRPGAGRAQRFSCACLALAVAACTTQLRRPAPPVQSAEPSTVAALASAIQADAGRSDHETDAHVRSELAAEADRDADACLSRAPQAAACLYGRALAFGLQARVHPTHAIELLNKMLDTLTRAESVWLTRAAPCRSGRNTHRIYWRWRKRWPRREMRAGPGRAINAPAKRHNRCRPLPIATNG